MKGQGQKQIKPLRVLGHERHSLKHGALNINKIESNWWPQRDSNPCLITAAFSPDLYAAYEARVTQECHAPETQTLDHSSNRVRRYSVPLDNWQNFPSRDRGLARLAWERIRGQGATVHAAIAAVLVPAVLFMTGSSNHVTRAVAPDRFGPTVRCSNQTHVGCRPYPNRVIRHLWACEAPRIP
jgi:hypothetical protein